MGFSSSLSATLIGLALTVTGTSQGLGLALLTEVLAIGERAVATLRNPDALLASDLAKSAQPGQLLVLPLDVSKPDQITAAFARTKQVFGRLDVVVNNAGYALMAEIEGTPDADARQAMEVMFWGPVNITKEVRRARGARIRVLTGVAGDQVLARYQPTRPRWTRAEHQFRRRV